MTMKISPHDWETLSAYIDGELSARAKKHLEARLQSEPALRNALENLRRTKNILRRAPRALAPRNFTLTPEMVGQSAKPRRSRLFPAFRLAAMLASVFLAAVLVLDFGGGIIGSQMAAAPRALEIAEEAPVMMESENFQEEAVEEVEAMDEAQAPQAEVEVAKEVEIEAVAEAESEMLGADAQTEAANAGIEEVEETEQEEGEKSAEPMAAGAEKITPTPTEEPPAPTLVATPQAVETAPAPRPPVSFLRVLEIVLGVAIVGFGVSALILKRQNNK